MLRIVVALVALVFSSVALAVLNLNTATKDELVALPGIGPAKAQAIVDYRNQHGPFRTVDELRKVKGIGEKLFLQIRSDVSVGNASRAANGQAVAKGDTAKSDAKTDPKAARPSAAGSIARDDKGKK
jgi:competence protein ComEA